ncbi:MAG: binding domain protein excisionase family [Solirubrobacterales bacterium]|jgi:excisionase family DNA binding protein|nr:binding domain protein excisionase family [Solirubrobacterales bacterium]
MPSPDKSPRGTEKPLFVRLPAEAAELLNRAAFEGGASKRELVTEMINRYLAARPVGDDPLVAVGERDLRVGRHAFRPDPGVEVLTLEQAAALLQVEPGVVAELAEAGELPARKVGDEWRFSRSALLAWLGAI